MTKFNNNLSKQQGFTIVELMIALTVLSTILIMSTVILIQIGALYNKGVNTAKLQNATRNVTSDVAGAIQFGGSQPVGCVDVNATCPAASKADKFPNNPNAPSASKTVYALCVGNTRYTYSLGREQGTDIGAANLYTAHVLWRDTMASATQTCSPLDLSQANPSGGVGNSSNGYEVAPSRTRVNKFTVTPNVTGTYNVTLNMALGDSDLFGPSGNCLGGKGSQFCATSSLSVTSDERVN